MEQQPIKQDEMIQSIRWKLGLGSHQDAAHSEAIWNLLAANPSFRTLVPKITEGLAGLLAQAFNQRIGLTPTFGKSKDDLSFLDSLCDGFADWVGRDSAGRILRLDHAIREALRNTRFDPPPRPSSAPHSGGVLHPYGTNTDARAGAPTSGASLHPSFRVDQPPAGSPPVAVPPAAGRIDLSGRPAPGSPKSPDNAGGPATPRPGSDHRADVAAIEPKSPAESTPPPQPVTPRWNYVPIPRDKDPAPHDDSYHLPLVTPGGLKLLGARVRGKKHKHEGTNCDDWFEFLTVGPWTLIAVADGAGSHKFSRVGAKVACRAAVGSLQDRLQDHVLRPRTPWSAETFRRDEAGQAFAEPDLEIVQETLHRAMHAAYEAVAAATAERAAQLRYTELMGRNLILSDLSCTLLLAVHATVLVKEGNWDFVMACQIGDGMSAAIYRNGTVGLLGEADSGEFSGQTKFLTMKSELSRPNLCHKTFPFLSPMRALMVMTDGVADDYFPNDPGMLRLYGDLVLNRIIELRGPGPGGIAAALRETLLPTPEDLERAEFESLMETPTAEGPLRATVRSVAAFAERLGKTIPEVIRSPALLAAGACKAVRGAETPPEARLRDWLDVYQVRGSFDDRTLVVLHREEDP